MDMLVRVWVSSGVGQAGRKVCSIVVNRTCIDGGSAPEAASASFWEMWWNNWNVLYRILVRGWVRCEVCVASTFLLEFIMRIEIVILKTKIHRFR